MYVCIYVCMHCMHVGLSMKTAQLLSLCVGGCMHACTYSCIHYILFMSSKFQTGSKSNIAFGCLNVTINITTGASITCIV